MIVGLLLALLSALTVSKVEAEDPVKGLLGEPIRAYPDLQPDVQNVTADGFLQPATISFDTWSKNLGNVPLQVTTDGADEDAMPTVSQCVAWDAEHEHVCREQVPVGGFTFHEVHGHFHYEEFATYSLRRLLPDGTPDYSAAGLLDISEKVSFCLIDTNRWRDDAPEDAWYTGGNCLAPVFMGISPGWADNYDSSIDGQTLEIEGLPDGNYALVIDQDPADRLLETDDTNNRVVATIRLRNTDTITPDARVVSRSWPATGGGGATTTTITTPTTTTPTTTTPTTTTTSPTPNRRSSQRRESGYWMLASDGSVDAFGDARWFGNVATGTARAVDLEPTGSGGGYWIVDELGRVFALGDARPLGAPPALAPGETVTSLSRTPTGAGYWLFTTRGRVVPYGDAGWYGDMSSVALNGPVLDSVPTPTGRGYYIVASDGGMFAFGDARFVGSMGGRRLNAPVQSLVPDSDGAGYWLVASDGGIFAFDAPFHGSMGAVPLNKPVTGMVGSNGGYLMVAEDGGIFAFGKARFHGSLGDNPPPHPITSVASWDSRG